MERAEESAKRFFAIILPGIRWDYTDHKAKPLVLAAFRLYAKEWSDNRWDIRRWEWPFAALRGEHAFDGDEPWTVLFRRALEIAKE